MNATTQPAIERAKWTRYSCNQNLGPERPSVPFILLLLLLVPSLALADQPVTWAGRHSHWHHYAQHSGHRGHWAQPASQLVGPGNQLTNRPKQYRILPTTTTSADWPETTDTPPEDSQEGFSTLPVFDPNSTELDLGQLYESTTDTPTTTTTTMPSLTLDLVLMLPLTLRLSATIVCVFVLVLGVSGNLLVPFVVCRTRELCNNSTNVFLINLSIADLLVLVVCMPTVLIELHTKPEVWILGEAMCKYPLSLLWFQFRMRCLKKVCFEWLHKTSCCYSRPTGQSDAEMHSATILSPLTHTHRIFSKFQY